VSLVGLMPVRRFFPHSDLSQTTVVRTQNKSQRASHEIFSKLISTFSALIHLDCESPKVPCFCGFWRVCFAIWTLWHNFPLFKVIGKITIYHFHGIFASKSHVLLAMRAHCHRILAIDSVLYFSQSSYETSSGESYFAFSAYSMTPSCLRKSNSSMTVHISTTLASTIP